MTEHQPLILVVDDSPNDAHLLREAFAESNVPVVLEPVRSGLDAVSRMGGGTTPSDRRPPDLVMLNVYLPAIAGADVLAYIKGEARHRDIPTLMYTCALRDADRAVLEGLGIDGCISKPQAFAGYPMIVETILDHLAKRFDDSDGESGIDPEVAEDG